MSCIHGEDFILCNFGGPAMPGSRDIRGEGQLALGVYMMFWINEAESSKVSIGNVLEGSKKIFDF